MNAKRGEPRDRANAVAPNPVAPDILPPTTFRQNHPTTLGQFDPQGYLANVSDIVALMTLEHQTQAANLITRLNWLARMAEARHGADLSIQQKMDAAVEDLLRYLFFVDEEPLQEPVQGVSTFSQTFPQMGPHDHRGRSLRAFNLRTRLFQYPLSYMIYSSALDTLPISARQQFYRRLRQVLSGMDRSGAFRQISLQDCADVIQILRDTKLEAGF